MKKSIISAIAVTAILSVAPLLQSCADTSSQTTYTTSSDPGYGYPPNETTTTNNQPEGVVGATGNVVGAVVEAPFAIVGDTLGILF